MFLRGKSINAKYNKDWENLLLKLVKWKNKTRLKKYIFNFLDLLIFFPVVLQYQWNLLNITMISKIILNQFKKTVNNLQV